MSEYQKTYDSREQILNRLRGRPASITVSLLAVFLTLLLSACSESSPLATQTTQLNTTVQPVSEQTQPPEETQLTEDTHADTEHAIRFTDSNVDIWPPQPEDITEVAAITDISVSSISTKLDNIQGTLIASLTRIYPLSTRHEILVHRVVGDKYGKTNHIQSEIFDYEKNQVITFEYDASSKEITRHSIQDASEYQPPESPTEVAHAIELASIDLSRQGFIEHINLSGTGLLAYPGTAESATSGASFFKQRKIYVTFGTGNGELPLYRALVNLSINSVESSGSIQ